MCIIHHFHNIRKGPQPLLVTGAFSMLRAPTTTLPHFSSVLDSLHLNVINMKSGHLLVHTVNHWLAVCFAKIFICPNTLVLWKLFTSMSKVLHSSRQCSGPPAGPAPPPHSWGTLGSTFTTQSPVIATFMAPTLLYSTFCKNVSELWCWVCEGEVCGAQELGRQGAEQERWWIVLRETWCSSVSFRLQNLQNMPGQIVPTFPHFSGSAHGQISLLSHP